MHFALIQHEIGFSLEDGNGPSGRTLTYQAQPTNERRKKMDKYECPCGYVYDPAEGDIENGIEPGTAWEDLPESWVCPLCGAEQEYFEKVE
jgi:rubredoxin